MRTSPNDGGYHRSVNLRSPRCLALAAIAVVASQAGHLLAYQLVFRSSAASIQSTGAHAYFPGVAKTSLGLIGAAILTSLLLIGVSRLIVLRPGTTVMQSPPYLRLFAALFTIQITFFVVQEAIEANLAGTYVPTALYLFLIGMVGQLPIAALAALALKWLSARLETALSALRTGVTVRVAEYGVLAPSLPMPELVYQPALAQSCPAAFVKRGPPPILRG
jgi:hypothetical protein